MDDSGLIYRESDHRIEGRGRQYRQTCRSSGNAALTSAGMNSVGKARSKSLSSVKVEGDAVAGLMMRDGGCEGTQRMLSRVGLNATCRVHDA